LPGQVFTHGILVSTRFDAAIGFVVFINSVFIGLEITAELNQHSTIVYDVSEHIFIVVRPGRVSTAAGLVRGSTPPGLQRGARAALLHARGRLLEERVRLASERRTG